MAEEGQVEELPLATDCNALTIDTNIFSNAGYGIEGGLLAQLEQFENSDVDLVFSDIVSPGAPVSIASSQENKGRASRVSEGHQKHPSRTSDQ